MENPVPEPAKKLTYEDYCAIPADGLRHEIIDGAHYMSPSPNLLHQGTSLNLTVALHAHLRTTKRGRVLVAPFDNLLGKHDVVVPDLLVVLVGGRGTIKKNGCHGPPDLVVEILSPSNPSHDTVRKRRLYERAGVREYWILDPANARAELYRATEDGSFAPPLVRFADKGECLETPLLPGFSLPLTEALEPDPDDEPQPRP